MPLRWITSGVLVAALSAAILAVGCASPTGGGDGFVKAATPPLPLSAGELKPGLAVLYFKHPFVRHLDDLPGSEAARAQGWSGPPIPYLNHRFGRDDVFDSGANRAIALEMSGFIRLDRPGTYGFQANSNDGFRLVIDDRLLIDDPSWHADRLSPEAYLTIERPGWYPLRLRYFQRKGTATLQLFWRPPGAGALTIVPAPALAHRESY